MTKHWNFSIKCPETDTKATTFNEQTEFVFLDILFDWNDTSTGATLLYSSGMALSNFTKRIFPSGRLFSVLSHF